MPRARVRCTSASTPLLWSVTRRTRPACRPGCVPADDPRGEHLALQRLPEVEQLAQACVLELHLREPIELPLEALRALAQDGVLASRMHQVRHAVPAPGHAAAER